MRCGPPLLCRIPSVLVHIYKRVHLLLYVFYTRFNIAKGSSYVWTLPGLPNIVWRLNRPSSFFSRSHTSRRNLQTHLKRVNMSYHKRPKVVVGNGYVDLVRLSETCIHCRHGYTQTLDPCPHLYYKARTFSCLLWLPVQDTNRESDSGNVLKLLEGKRNGSMHSPCFSLATSRRRDKVAM